MNSVRVISPTTARRLAITKQHLAARKHAPTADDILRVVHDIGCLQLDPLQTVARSHTLVTFARVGPYDTALLDQLIYQDRALFEYWAHAASIVPTRDYPIHHLHMRTYAKTKDAWDQRIAAWIRENKKLRDYILHTIKRNGPTSSRELTESGIAPKAWVSSGWTSDRNISRMLDFLWMQGKIMVAKRQGLNKFWDLSERVLPEWTPREKLSEREIVTRAAQTSLRALGVATEKQIAAHYIAGRYPQLRARLHELERAGEIERIEIRAGAHDAWQGTWYIHRADTALLDDIERAEFKGRTVLLSPFDNLVRDRARNVQFWDFDYKIEIYVPQAKRKYGYYVLPILHGDQLIGRIDPQMDRANGVLNIHAVYLENAAPRDKTTARAVRNAIEELAQFLNAREIKYGARVPDTWKNILQ